MVVKVLFVFQVFQWTEEKLKHFGGHEFMLSEEGHLLTVRFKFGAEVLIKRHSRHGDVSYLNLFVKHEDGFSKRTTGLIGQFVNGFKHIYQRKQFTNKSGKQVAKLQIKEGAKFPSKGNAAIAEVGEQTRRRIPAKLVSRADVIEKGTEMCWMVHKQFGDALFGGRAAFLKKDLIDT